MFKKILVPLDGSPLAESIVPVAMQMAKLAHAEIAILAVISAWQIAYAEGTADIAALSEHFAAQCTEYLELLAARLRKDGLTVQTYVDEGYVPDVICDVAERIDADLIAMATHGRSGIQRWLLGGTADKVLHISKVPVLLIRPKDPASA